MSCTKQTVEETKQDDTKRSEGWLGPGSLSRENKMGGASRRGTFIHLQPSVIIQDLHWARYLSSCQGRNSVQNKNEDVVGGGRCIL